MDVQTEVRKFRRFVPEENAFVAFRPEFKKLGRITDISRGGLGCEYLAHKEGKESSPQLEIDILLSRDGFYMSWVPCKVVYDIHVTKDEYPPGYGLQCRRCGLKFWELAEEQKEEVEFFLKNHVLGIA